MDINLSNIPRAFTSFLHRYHVIVFVIVVFGALGLGIFIIYQKTLATDHSQGYTAQTDNATFDSQTIERIRKLYPSDYRLELSGNTKEEIIQRIENYEKREIDTTGDMNPFVE